jgi:hypothetical protein
MNMKKNSVRGYWSGTVALLAMLVASTASAAPVSIVTPWGDLTPVEVRIGLDDHNTQWAIYKQRNNPNACQAFQIGGTNGFSGRITINASSADDLIVVQNAVEVHCGLSIRRPVPGGFTLELRGRGGNDVMLGGVSNTVMYGGTGNDILAGDGLGMKLYGEANDDDVEGWGAANDEILYGDSDTTTLGEGNDCLFDQTDLANTVACGSAPGTTDKWTTINDFNIFVPASCEVAVTCCSWAHFVGQC